MNFQASVSDPDEFNEAILPVAGNVKAQASKGGRFTARIDAASLLDVAVFRLRVCDLRVADTGPRTYLSLTIPLLHAIEIGGARSADSVYEPGEAHLLPPDTPFDCLCEGDASVLVINLEASLVESVLRALDPAGPLQLEEMGGRLSLATAEGASMGQLAQEIWRHSHEESRLLDSRCALAELSHSLAYSLVAVAKPTPPREQAGNGHSPALARAAEFIAANLDRPLSAADIVTAADADHRTLYRAFKRKYGMPPVAFARQRRLEAAQRRLLAAEPSELRVTHVALRYGFWHLGRFSCDYRRAFGERPSDTLRR